MVESDDKQEQMEGDKLIPGIRVVAEPSSEEPSRTSALHVRRKRPFAPHHSLADWHRVKNTLTIQVGKKELMRESLRS
jgi:hypothetical protein